VPQGVAYSEAFRAFAECNSAIRRRAAGAALHSRRAGFSQALARFNVSSLRPLEYPTRRLRNAEAA
jgi:hypothetical protein